MAVDIYMHIDGIPGESTDSVFKDEIELLSFSHNMRQTGTQIASTAGGATSGRINIGDFTVVKPLDMGSPKAFAFCASGQHINNIWIKLRRAGSKQHVYYEYHFTNCIISSITKDCDGRSDETLPTETITFNFDSMKEIYHKQEREGGTPSGSVEAGYSTRLNALM